jgi:mRNA-degrading endonuclease toxin of MazEF toxin-antitoxin module
MTSTPPSGPTPQDFDDWNTRKKAIHTGKAYPAFFKDAEVWWCSLGVNIGFEQNGDTMSHNGQPATYRRPVLVLRKLGPESCIILPLTTRPHTGSYFHALPNPIDGEQAWVMLTQVRNITASRLTVRVVELPGPIFRDVKAAYRRMMRL